MWMLERRSISSVYLGQIAKFLLHNLKCPKSGVLSDYTPYGYETVRIKRVWSMN